MDLDAYRGSAESFISELTGAYYRHYAGLEAEYEIEPIYGRHASLFTPDAVSRLRDHADAAPSETDQQRRARMLVDFPIEGNLAQQTDFFTAETDTVYEPMLEPELRRSLGIGVAQLRRADIPRFFRAPDQDRWFPAQRLVPSLIESHRWLELHLGIEDTAELVLHARAQRLIYLRRYAAKLRYELELHGGRRPLDELPRRYAQLLGSALRIDWPQQTYLADVDPGFYSACYLRAWALEAHLRNYLEQRFGQEWFTKPEAGHTLKQLWSQGQRLTAEELLQELTNEQLDFSILLRDLQLGKPDRT
jgi:hypothetical protein